jgi:hypothetical protein
MTDLVKRLRCYADLNDAVFHPWVYGEAADEIERLLAENKRLRAAFRINMLRLNPALRHAEIDALLGESPARGGEKTDG